MDLANFFGCQDLKVKFYEKNLKVLTWQIFSRYQNWKVNWFRKESGCLDLANFFGCQDFKVNWSWKESGSGCVDLENFSGC